VLFYTPHPCPNVTDARPEVDGSARGRQLCVLNCRDFIFELSRFYCDCKKDEQAAMKTSAALAAACAAVFSVAPATAGALGTPIPTTLSDIGWQIGTAGAPMSIDIYGDFQCPDTKAAWEGWIKDFRSLHGEVVSIVFHPFPLPYHKNGFDAAQAAIVMVDALHGNGDNFVTVADALFDAQDSFQTTATVNISQAELFQTILAPIASKVGVNKTEFLSHMNNNDDSNSIARVAWKAGCAVGVSGTPSFAANGVVNDELAQWTLGDWDKWLAAGKRHMHTQWRRHYGQHLRSAVGDDSW